MNKLVVTVVCLLGLLVVGQSGVMAGLGDVFYATGGDVVVRVEPASAGYTSLLQLYSPVFISVADNSEAGKVVNLGSFTAGQELTFGIYVLNTQNTFLMGPGSRNADGEIHANVEWQADGSARVGFEDLFGGGDRDYNDNMFLYMTGVKPNPTVPEPASISLAIMGFITAGGLKLRRK